MLEELYVRWDSKKMTCVLHLKDNRDWDLCVLVVWKCVQAELVRMWCFCNRCSGFWMWVKREEILWRWWNIAEQVNLCVGERTRVRFGVNKLVGKSEWRGSWADLFVCENDKTVMSCELVCERDRMSRKLAHWMSRVHSLV
jgi:hypothetical protein